MKTIFIFLLISLAFKSFSQQEANNTSSATETICILLKDQTPTIISSLIRLELINDSLSRPKPVAKEIYNYDSGSTPTLHSYGPTGVWK